MKTIPYGRQHINKQDIAEVVKALKLDFITQGAKIKEFENALAKYCGAKYTVVVSSGTAALHLACISSGLKKGDEAITTPITFLATANSVSYTGAKVIFADIDYDTMNIDPEQLSKKITSKTKVVLPVHFAGLPCNMEKISSIARKHKLSVIEDAAHALGAEYKYRNKWYKVGSCKHSDMTTFSFHPVKHITTGEGGAITTNSKKIYEKLLMLRSHGISKNDNMNKKHGPWYYEMKHLGFNYRITDFQCALGLSQLKKLDTFVNRRRKIALIYEERLSGIKNIILPLQSNDNMCSSWHLYVIRLLPVIDGESLKKKVFNYLESHGIKPQVHYIPVYYQPYYKNLGYKKGLCLNSEEFYRKAISLPIYPWLKNNELYYVINTVTDAIKKYVK